MDKKNKHKVHLGTNSLRSACGIIYPVRQTPCFLKYIDCKRCLASHEYKKKKQIEAYVKSEVKRVGDKKSRRMKKLLGKQ